MILTSSSRAATLATAETDDNPFVTGAPLAGTWSTTDSDATEILPASNVVTGTTYDPWTASSTTGEVNLQVVFPSPVTPTMIAIAAHNLGDVGARIRTRYDDAGTITTTDAGTAEPTNNDAIVFRFEGFTSDTWIIRIDLAVSAPVDLYSIGVVYIGSEIILPTPIYRGYAPPITPNAVDLRTNVSEGGNLLGAAYAERGSRFNAEFSDVPSSFVRSDSWKTWQRRWNRGNGSFWGWRPKTFGDAFYTWRGQSDAVVAPTNSGPLDYTSFNIAGRAYDE